jgi:hypothetical protein
LLSETPYKSKLGLFIHEAYLTGIGDTAFNFNSIFRQRSKENLRLKCPLAISVVSSNIFRIFLDFRVLKNEAKQLEECYNVMPELFGSLNLKSCNYSDVLLG